MISDLLLRGFRRNQRIIHAQADGLSHEEALSQSEHNVNCFNWVLGHIVKTRDDIFELLGADRVMSGEQAERYLSESEPITEDGPGVVAFVDLLALLDSSEQAIEAALAVAGDAYLDEEILAGGDRKATRAAQVMFGILPRHLPHRAERPPTSDVGPERQDHLKRAGQSVPRVFRRPLPLA